MFIEKNTMREYRYFKPTDNVMQKYDVSSAWNNETINNHMYQRQILMYTMMPLKDTDINDDCYVHKVIQHYTFLLRGLQRILKDSYDSTIFSEWKDSEDKIIELEQIGMFGYPNTNYDDLFNYVIDRFLVLKYFAHTEDYFVENNHIDEKMTEINDLLSYFEEECNTLRRFEIIADLKEFEILEEEEDDDENDGESE